MENEPTLEWRGPNGTEMVGRFTGMRFIMGRGWLTYTPDPNWGNVEAKRLAATGSPVVWVYGSHLPQTLVDRFREGLASNVAEIATEEAKASGVVWQVRPAPAQPAGTFPVGQRPTGVALGAGSVWTANSVDGTVTRIDLGRGTTSTIEVGGVPNELVFSNGRLWVSVG